jgi:hypothetical protein
MFSTVIVAYGDQIHAGVEQNPLIGFLVGPSRDAISILHKIDESVVKPCCPEKLCPDKPVNRPATPLVRSRLAAAVA